MQKSFFEQRKEMGFITNPNFNQCKIPDIEITDLLNTRLLKKLDHLDLIFLKKSDLKTYNDWKTNKNKINKKFGSFFDEARKELSKANPNHIITKMPKSLIYLFYLRNNKPKLFKSKYEVNLKKSTNVLKKLKLNGINYEKQIKFFKKKSCFNISKFF